MRTTSPSPTPPEVAPRGRYSGTAAAALLGINRGTLRKYTNAGLIQRRESKIGRPYYLGSDIAALWRML